MPARPVCTRRQVLIGGLAGGVAGLSMAAASRAQTPAPKATKEAVHYQDAPKDIRMCATCSLFEEPKSCKVVEGDVAPEGWCDLFVLVD